MDVSLIEILATVFFALAIIHTFLVSKFELVAYRQPKGSIAFNLWHYFAEVEVVFGLWSLVFITFVVSLKGTQYAIDYLEGLNFTEVAFVFVIMCMAATRPVILLAEKIIQFFARLLPFPEQMSFYISAVVVGPLLGSFITEPAAMTVTAFILHDTFFKHSVSLRFKYGTLALLLVNISIGGTLTNFAAPPVLMVAAKWGWNTEFMLRTFGYKALISIVIGSALYTWSFRKELQGTVKSKHYPEGYLIPKWWKIIVQVFLLFIVVYTAHHPKVFIGVFCFFLGFVSITQKYQNDLKIKESFLVAFFLAGLVTLGSMQSWWLRPLLSQMGDFVLFLGATGLTAITDNAALTYLGSLVDLSEQSKYALVAGAVAGGGLTVIANAPNPVAVGVFKDAFGKEGISPIRLLLFALLPTLIAMFCFFFLPTL